MTNANQTLSASSVIGNQVKNLRGENLGKVEELIIDPDTGRIVGALLSHQNPPDGEQISAIPWDAMTLSHSDGAIYVDSETLSHPHRRDRDWPGTSAPQLPRNIVVYTSSIYKASPVK